MKLNYKSVSGTSWLLGVFVVLLIGLSAYLVYSNNKLRQSSVAPEEESNNKVTGEILEQKADLTLEETKEKTEVKKPVASSAPVVKKSVSSAPPTKDAWASFYDELGGLEGEFFVDYEAVSLDNENQSSIDFELDANEKAKTGLGKILSKVDEGKLKFSNQLSCLNKEREAFEKYGIVIDKSDTYLKFQSKIIKFDDINEDLGSKLNSYVLRMQDEDYDKAINIIVEISDLLDEAKLNAQEANKIISLDAFGDYVEWIDLYSSGVDEYYNEYKRKNYDYEGDTDFIELGEKMDEAISDLADQLNDWTVLNLESLITEADRLYSQSNSLCLRE